MNTIKQLVCLVTFLAFAPVLVAAQHNAAPVPDAQGAPSWLKSAFSSKTRVSLTVGAVATCAGLGYWWWSRPRGTFAKIQNAQKMLAVSAEEEQQAQDVEPIAQPVPGKADNARNSLPVIENGEEQPDMEAIGQIWVAALAELYGILYPDMTEVAMKATLAALNDVLFDPHCLLANVDFMTRLVKVRQMKAFYNVLMVYKLNFITDALTRLTLEASNQEEMYKVLGGMKDLSELADNMKMLNAKQQKIARGALDLWERYQSLGASFEALMNAKDPENLLRKLLA